MTNEEMTQLDILWEPTFNKGWLYLSDDMIKSQLTNDKSKDALGNFYRQVLTTSDYIVDKDYKSIEYEDPLIDLYFKSRSLNLKTGNKPRKVNGKRYYAVTGETYKDLIARASTEGGKAARALFRKVESLARLMYDYILAHEAITAQKRIEEEKTLRIEAESNVIALEKEKRGPKEYPKEWFYMATCDLMARSRAYKFGIITKDNTPKKRISAYDCGYLEFISLNFVYLVETNNAKAIEDAFRTTVFPYLKNTHKDVVLLSFDVCKRIADQLTKVTEINITSLLEMEQKFPQLGKEPKPVYLREDGELKCEGMSPAAKPNLSCPKCGKVYSRGGFLTAHEAKCIGPKPIATCKSVRLAVKQSDRIDDKPPNELTIEVVVE